MELRHLRYFIAVAEQGSFTRAADKLHTVQPSLSRQIKELEEQIGTALLERTSRHVRLTEAGKVFLEEAKQILHHVNRMVERTQQAARQKQKLVIGFLPGSEPVQLKWVMKALRQHPDIELVMQNQSSPSLIDALHERRLDAAFIRPSSQATSLCQHIVMHDPLIVALPSQHPLTRYDAIPIEALRHEPLINVMKEQSPVLFDTTMAYASEHGVELDFAFKSENLGMALSLISTMGGIGLLPSQAISLFPPGVSHRPLQGTPPSITLALAWHPDNMTFSLRTLLENLKIDVAEYTP